MSTNITSPGRSGDSKRKGSVKRARQLLEAGIRPAQASPHQERDSPITRKMSRETQWPLADSSLPAHPVKHHSGPSHSRGPPPQRPPHPNEMPSPSIYSVRHGEVSVTSLDRDPMPPRSFPKLQPPPPLQLHQPFIDAPVSPTSTVDIAPRISISTDDLFRNSAASSTPSVPNLPPFPPPFAPPESRSCPDNPQCRTAGLVAPPNARRPPQVCRSAVSPIPESLPDPRSKKCSVASSRAIPSSWGSGPAESEILGAYLDMDSDTDPSCQRDDTMIVRNASLGKRGKPTMRTHLKSNPASGFAAVDTQALTHAKHTRTVGVASAGVRAAANQMFHPSTQQKTPTSTASVKPLNGANPENPPLSQQHESIYSTGLEKELEAFGALSRPAPTLSDSRPGGHKPPALNIHAVRDAEARGSLSSLSDLIRRATKLASNLDRGRTVSCEAEFKGGIGKSLKSNYHEYKT
jgi:hypothetical protein